MTVRILSNTVLPAGREPVTLSTADGCELVGELALPADRPVRATLVTLHPLPTAGGSMESHLLRKMAWRLPALAGLAVLRFNTRGTGGSTGRFDGGAAERLDVAAALDLVESRDLPHVWLVGWSFGADLALMHGGDPTVEGAVLLSPPLRSAGAADLDAWAATGRPLVCVVPELDDNLRPDPARAAFARVPSARVVEVARAKHLFVGFADAALDEVVRPLAPELVPLPRDYDPATTGPAASGPAAPGPATSGPAGGTPPRRAGAAHPRSAGSPR